MYGLPEDEVSDYSHYAARVQDTLHKAYNRVRNRLPGQLQRQKELYDQRVHKEPFEPGSGVVALYCSKTGDATSTLDRLVPCCEEVKCDLLALRVKL